MFSRKKSDADPFNLDPFNLDYFVRSEIITMRSRLIFVYRE